MSAPTDAASAAWADGMMVAYRNPVNGQLHWESCVSLTLGPHTRCIVTKLAFMAHCCYSCVWSFVEGEVGQDDETLLDSVDASMRTSVCYVEGWKHDKDYEGGLFHIDRNCIGAGACETAMTLLMYHTGENVCGLCFDGTV
jgi:hypothetical protein